MKLNYIIPICSGSLLVIMSAIITLTKPNYDMDVVIQVLSTLGLGCLFIGIGFDKHFKSKYKTIAQKSNGEQT